MSIQGLSSAYDTSLTAATSQFRQENADQGFANLLSTGSDSSKKVVGTPLTPSAVQPTSDSQQASNKPLASTSTKEKTPAEQFLEYMSKTPQQRWQEAWLKQHGYTPEQFAALPAEKKQALMDEMAQDMKEQMRQTAEKKTTDSSTI